MSKSKPDDVAIRTALKGQYRAALKMLTVAVEQFPEDAWALEDERNPSWQIAYHTLYYTHLYLQPSFSQFTARPGHKEDYSALGAAVAADPVSKENVLDYARFCEQHVDAWMDDMDLGAPSCGFWWYEMGKLEHQLVNLRHLQHHAAQLADRLRQRTDVGVDWVASA